MVKENKVTFGLENAHYAKITFGANGVPTFATPVPLKGSVEFTMDPESNSVEFPADNDSQYYTADENNGYSGTLTIANLPLSFRKDILGEELDETDGTITELADAKFSPFALLFQFDGDATKTRHLIYYCNGSRATISSKTGKDISGVELPFKSKQLTYGERKLVKTQTTSDESTKYGDWFKAVYLKEETPGKG
ncbi:MULTISPECIES: major tail protein [unclassified Enterococcus]|uniref:major tail protein n=1 Tax=unclassified Enterococcus TaxID=2608891 RepID=UPI0015573ED0|nr:MULTISPECIES: major tail protein [unclassified Enterococcus]MBS7578457.1 phage tail protein [Enterococcus sp. MMGLQ5-2]MBS7585678.1 phage tail protein [Enterococcus sp. MMGLQ5-1]NPD13537.1 phage tail protein [Enterococcus sp. MMGLQ5-1]NPD38289.1 phage tail protein [Enterococcus sp. MMGLQ5-2]